MTEGEIAELKGRIHALEVAVVTNMLIDAMNDKTPDLAAFGEQRKEVWEALAEAADDNPELAKGLNRLAKLSTGMATAISDGYAKAMKKGGSPKP